MKNSKTFITKYEAWKKNLEGHRGHGSFETNLFLAYRSADEKNTEILQAAFPKLFVYKTVEYHPVSKMFSE